MPRACPVVVHAGRYRPGRPTVGATGLSRGGSRWPLSARPSDGGCHGLVPWWFTLAAIGPAVRRWMPRACPVVVHAGRYSARPSDGGCHGLVPWWFTLAATPPGRP